MTYNRTLLILTPILTDETISFNEKLSLRDLVSVSPTFDLASREVKRLIYDVWDDPNADKEFDKILEKHQEFSF